MRKIKIYYVILINLRNHAIKLILYTVNIYAANHILTSDISQLKRGDSLDNCFPVALVHTYILRYAHTSTKSGSQREFSNYSL